MRCVRLCVMLLALLLPRRAHCQREYPDGSARLAAEDADRTQLAVDVLNHSGILNALFPSEYRPTLRQARVPRPASRLAPKRAQQGSRFALSLDVPTSILSALIDLAKNQDMRAKAAANAELMARIGRRK